jgi:photosystem II stability/assembly factor-like uncharacterized protein
MTRQRRLTLFSLFLSVCLLFGNISGPVLASTTAWTPVGPASARVHAIVVNPLSTNVVYAATDSGVYKSINNGSSWDLFNSGLTTTLVWTLAIDPKTPATLYAGTYGGGVFKTTTGAETWSPASAGLTDQVVLSLAVDPLTPTTLYAGTGTNDISGVFKSINGGDTWTATGAIGGQIINVVAINPLAPATLYACTGTAGIYKTVDSGDTWTAINSGLTSSNVKSLIVFPAHPDYLFAGTAAGGFLRSSDAGGSWRAQNAGLGSASVPALGMALNGTVLTFFAGTPAGVFTSQNGGGTWTAFTSGLTSLDVISFGSDPQSTKLFAGTNTSGAFLYTSGTPIPPPNQAPTDIQLNSTSVGENQPAGAPVGYFTTSDPNSGESFTYTFVAGEHSTDNASFALDNYRLKTAAAFSAAAKSSYAIRVRSTDKGGLYFEKAFTITVIPAGSALPQISSLSPTQGVNTVENRTYVKGANFTTTTVVFLGDTPLSTSLVDPVTLRAVIPAQTPPGIYNVSVSTSGGPKSTLQNAYTLLSSTADDLTSDGLRLWVTPGAPLVNQTAQIGLVVSRIGGTATLANVSVRFYESVPGHSSKLIGDGVVPFLAPNSSAASMPIDWTPTTAGNQNLYALIDPDHKVTESNENNNALSRPIVVAGSNGDQAPPRVDSFSINSGDAQTASTSAVLNVTASDPDGGSGVAKLEYLEFEYTPAVGMWVPIHRSGWLSFTAASANYPWQLLPTPGFRVIQAWVADAVGNISLLPGQQAINYLPASDSLQKDQARVYRFKLNAGDTFSGTLTPTAGDPDLYVWPPDHDSGGRNPWVSNTISGADQVSFTAPVAGWYQVEVRAASTCAFQLTVVVTPNISSGASAENNFTPQGSGKTILTTPAIPLNSNPDAQVGLDPLNNNRIFLPRISNP